MSSDETIVLNIPLLPDGAGYFGFECPQCERYFKVLASGVREDTKHVYCTYCGHHDEAEHFLTEDVIEQVKGMGADRIAEQMHQRLQDMLVGAFRGSKNVKLTRGSTEHRPARDRPLERDLPNEHVCIGCALKFAYEGGASFCPQCYASLNSIGE